MSEHKRNPLAAQFGGPKPPPAILKDALGKPLSEGDELMLVVNKTFMRVAALHRTLLAPGTPPNTMTLVLQTEVRLVVPCGAQIAECYLMRHQAEIGDGIIHDATQGEGAVPTPLEPLEPQR